MLWYSRSKYLDVLLFCEAQTPWLGHHSLYWHSDHWALLLRLPGHLPKIHMVEAFNKKWIMYIKALWFARFSIYFVWLLQINRPTYMKISCCLTNHWVCIRRGVVLYASLHLKVMHNMISQFILLLFFFGLTFCR